jgi:hypothetical protein
MFLYPGDRCISLPLNREHAVLSSALPTFSFLHSHVRPGLLDCIYGTYQSNYSTSMAPKM